MPGSPVFRYYFCMATVLIEVTLPYVEDRTNDLPADVLALVAAATQVQEHGWSKRGGQPWRAQFLVRGTDCIATARSLEGRLRDLGYEADASFWP